MLFKTPQIQSEFANLHPELRVLLHDLDEWLFDSKMERLTVTDALRTPADQERIYLPKFLKKGLPEDEAREEARAQFSWHLLGCAADFRHTFKPYTEEEQKHIWEWLKERCDVTKPDLGQKEKAPEWELLLHDVGLGKHFHVARRDFLLLRKWEQQQKRGGVA